MSEPQAVPPIEQAPRTIYLKDYEVPTFFIDEVFLNFELYETHTLVTSRMRIRHNRLSSNKSRDLVLVGEELTLDSIKLNKQVLTTQQYQVADGHLKIANVPDNFELEIITKIHPEKNTTLSGLYRSQDTYCTQCEAEGFRRITYYLDQPDILSRFTTTISAEESKYPYLLSNGNLIASGKLDGGRHWVTWEDPFKKPCYLFALVAGDFDAIDDKFTTQSGREVELKFYVEKGYRDQVQHAIHSLKEAMRWDEKTYGREYDLDIYMIVAIGDFNMGAMENKGLNIFNTKYILAKPSTATDDDYIHILSVVGHEYFHNWTGNRVTCRDWFQLSLKEGLTIFRDQTFTEDTMQTAVIRIQEVRGLRETQFPEDAGPFAHPVRPDAYIEINNFYTATVYNKGAEVLRMLRTLLGETLFRKGMDLYFARHDGQAVTIEDYIKTMEDVSGVDLTQFRLWYSQAGTPIVTVADDYDASQQIYTLTISQNIPPTPRQEDKKPMLIPIRMGLLDETGSPIPLHIGDERVEKEKVLKLTDSLHTFKFKNVLARPTPSLLRQFSAPVILKYPYAESDLSFLLKHDPDAFNRFEAGQNYAIRIMLNLILDLQHQKKQNIPQDFLANYAFLLEESTNDKYLLAEMLTLPSEKYLGEQMSIIDVDAIHAVRENVSRELATNLEKLLLKHYELNHDTDPQYVFNEQAIGKRQLKNRCLHYLCKIPHYDKLAMKQFEVSLKHNMTDTMSALVCLSNLESNLRERALETFYNTWKEDALVVDKWFAVQAASFLPNALQQVKRLMRHEAFDIKNPNKVYALIGTFGYRNAVHFHAENGEGYAFLRDTVQQLDDLNPVVAARMVKPLTTWRRYDKERQELMKAQLNLLLSDASISKDLYEIVVKSLD